MREFWIRVVSLIAVAGILVGYNSVLDAREKNEEIAKLKAQVTETQSAESDDSNYKDGTYQGEAEGFGGTVAVEVTVEKGKITAVEIVSAQKEDGAYLSMAKDIIPKIIEAQSADVDTISGATFSSTGIKNASQEALEKAVK